ncbi:hypothetical protein PoB_000275300 [Plakobranchus ocellatus]|uniref:Uncharacterized protein n=1 Tax=Plakobranchus ocellatus TaxID=259542 RepID=A0AAV3Y0S9_9GAST|nr:hypothetical protein PoB_000275300 [Plakobranchus ocellatus]
MDSTFVVRTDASDYGVGTADPGTADPDAALLSLVFLLLVLSWDTGSSVSVRSPQNLPGRITSMCHR